MGIYIIKTPDIGEGIAEVELVAWHVKPGDEVHTDQLLADVMTDKATVEIPSPVSGRVVAINGEVGQVVAVGSELIRLEVAGVGNVKASAAVPRPPPAAAALPNAPTVRTLAPVQATTALSASRSNDRSEERGMSGSTRVAESLAQPAAGGAGLTGERPIASPAVRRRAWDIGVELEQVTPTGTGGRVMQADLDTYVSRNPGLAAKPALPPAVAVPRVQVFAEVNTEQAIAVIGLRRKIAAKMQESKRRIPHFTYVEEVDVTEIEALRERLKAQRSPQRPRITLLPLLARAMVLALREFPQINARFDDERGVVTRFGAVHLGIATQTDNGLMVPVLRHAEALDLWACASGIARVAEAARTGHITREELSGSTITLTSLGALGGIVSTPVINHPEVAIVGVNRIVERPMVHRGAVVARQMMNLSSSFDHRVVDGADAARFIQAVRAYLEVPLTLFIE
ncbi:MAG: 2-oxo acid dehydrogenase subunit E2 [Rhodoferax sp.]|nr:2-oxo acid dehydrogenase subunit E2 [Rhodoferax sp.]